MQAECGFHHQKDGDKKLILDGPTITVVIGFDPSVPVPGSEFSPSHIPNITIPALVDTGAQECYIDTTIAKALQLPRVNRTEICGSNGKHIVDVYLAQIMVPALGWRHLGRFAGVRLMDGGQSHGALLGRTFLQHMQMTYHGDSGQVTVKNIS